MKKDFNLYQCNPSTLQHTHTTCLPQDMILRLRDEWNTRFPQHQIPHSIRKKDDVWKELRARLYKQYTCSSEYCALEKLGTDSVKTSGERYFRPSKPAEWLKNPREWLDSLSIARVMNQYEDAIPHFEFIGPVPIDYDAILPNNWGKCIVDELCSLDLQSLRQKGTHSIGVIFNLDPHDKPGSHWVCSYVDIKGGKVYYYDSYGYEPCAEIKRFMRKCAEQGCTETTWNKVRHQRKNSECGTYCMYVIISLVKGKSFAEICNKPIDDDTMNAFRDLLYATTRPSDVAIRKVVELLSL